MKYNSSEIWALVRNIKKDLRENSIDGTISDGLFSAIDNVNIYDYSKNYITDGNCTPIEIIYDSLLQNYTDYLITSAYPFFSSDIFIVDSEEEQLNLIIKKGDICIRNDISTSFFALGTKNYSINEDWVEILTSGSGGSSGINIHNDLNGIEGMGPNYYHLNSEEYLNLHDPVTVNLPLVLSGQDISLNYDKNIFDIINDELTIITSAFELDNYYTKTQLQTSGQSSVHWGNITNAPAFITSVNWDEIGGDQSLVNVSDFNNDAGYLTSLPSHDHDTRYYTKTQLQTSGQSSVHANNITDAPWLTSLPSHNHDTRYYTKDYIDDALSGKSDTDHTHSKLYAGDTVQLEVTEEGIIKLSHSWGLIPKDGELLIVEQNGDGSWPTKGFSVKSY